MSKRVAYWLQRIGMGFKPNRRLSQLSYDDRARFYGVSDEEQLKVLDPALNCGEHEWRCSWHADSFAGSCSSGYTCNKCGATKTETQTIAVDPNGLKMEFSRNPEKFDFCPGARNAHSVAGKEVFR